MKQVKYIIIISLWLPVGLWAQSEIDLVLQTVEQNNTKLAALKEKAKAEQLANQTGNYLQNPEVEFNYLWSDPSSLGSRQDFSITQSFDFPTAYRYKSQIRKFKNEQVELEYQKHRKDILLQAQQVCLDLIYTNKLIILFDKRLDFAKELSNSYKSKLDQGDANIMDFNKAKLNELKQVSLKESALIEKKALLSKLEQLNGNKAINFELTEFNTQLLSKDFDSWCQEVEQTNPMLAWLKKELELSHKQTQLKRSLSLPKIQAGYMSETVVGQSYKGLSVGLSIPLWENRNTIRAAKANSLAIEQMEIDYKLEFINKLNRLYTKTSSLIDTYRNYESQLNSLNHSELLQKALTSGEINLIEYIMESSIYFESQEHLLQMELEINQNIAELNHYAL